MFTLDFIEILKTSTQSTKHTKNTKLYFLTSNQNPFFAKARHSNQPDVYVCYYPVNILLLFNNAYCLGHSLVSFVY